MAKVSDKYLSVVDKFIFNGLSIKHVAMNDEQKLRTMIVYEAYQMWMTDKQIDPMDTCRRIASRIYGDMLMRAENEAHYAALCDKLNIRVGVPRDYDRLANDVYTFDHIVGRFHPRAASGGPETVKLGVLSVTERSEGNANGMGISVTSGALSVESEYIQMGKTDGSNTAVRYRVMRTDAPINHGNSGGGLYNAQGELIGITNAKNVEDETDNMGYALPITQVKYLVENMLYNVKAGLGGYVSRAMLGITTVINSSSAKIVNGKLTIVEECVVSNAPEAGTASYNKLFYGDILKSVTIKGINYPLTRNFYLPELLLTVRYGETITLHIVGNDQQAKDVAITFATNHFVKYA